ncbi:MAG: MgtC/SapB family protein [Acidobacteriota bacterium]
MGNEFALFQDVAIKLLIASILGGLIGFEREIHEKPAGLRTNALISLGSALIMIISIYVTKIYGTTASDPGRIAAQVITGIGFIGAGVILQSRGSIKGLTTAATIWSVTGVGLAVGCGFYTAALTATIIILIVLLAIGRIEQRFLRNKE